MLRNRIIWTILFILALIGITLYGGPVSYGFLALVIMVPIIAVFYMWCVYFFFGIYQSKDVNRPVVGEVVPFHFRLMDASFFAFSGIRVKFFTSFSSIEGLDDEAEYELIPGKGIYMDTDLVCKYRGSYEVGIKTVEIQDFFRLFRFSYHNKETMRIEAIPKLISLDKMNCLDQVSVLKETKSLTTWPDVFVREYVAGDDVRQINWKVSSHVGKLMVRKQISEEKQGIGIILDSKRYTSDQLLYLPVENKMLETALAISLYFAEKQTPVSTWVGNQEIDTYRVSRLDEFDNYYEAMADIEFKLDEVTNEEIIEATSDKKKAEQPDTIGKEQVGSTNVYSLVSDDRNLYDCKMIFIITQTLSDEMRELSDLLSTNGVFVQICLVQGHEDVDINYAKSNNENLVRISLESDLTEVL